MCYCSSYLIYFILESFGEDFYINIVKSTITKAINYVIFRIHLTVRMDNSILLILMSFPL